MSYIVMLLIQLYGEHCNDGYSSLEPEFERRFSKKANELLL